LRGVERFARRGLHYLDVGCARVDATHRSARLCDESSPISAGAVTSPAKLGRTAMYVNACDG
jgi:hypothetical protein